MTAIALQTMVRATLVICPLPSEENAANPGTNHTFSSTLVSILSWKVLLTFAGTPVSWRTGSGASHQSQPGTIAQYQQIVVSVWAHVHSICTTITHILCSSQTLQNIHESCPFVSLSLSLSLSLPLIYTSRHHWSLCPIQWLDDWSYSICSCLSYFLLCSVMCCYLLLLYVP